MASDALAILPVPEVVGAFLRLGGGDADRAREAVSELHAYLANKPANTRRTYKQGLQEFLDLVGWKDLREVTINDAANYKNYLIEKGYADSTICTRLAAVTGYFAFLTRPRPPKAPTLVHNPFDVVDRSGVQPTPFGRSVPIAWEDYEKMIAALPDDVVGKRDRAVLVFIAYTGRRRSEVARLKLGNLDLSKRPREYTVKVKGNKTKSWHLPDEAYDAMHDHWVSAGRISRLGPDSAVFGDVSGSRLSDGLDPERTLHDSVIWAIVKRAAAGAGLDPSRYRTHGLRHMYARRLDLAGARAQDIQKALGHEGLNTTSIYLGQLDGAASALTEFIRQGPLKK